MKEQYYTMFYTSKPLNENVNPPNPDYNVKGKYGWKTNDINSVFSYSEHTNKQYGSEGWKCFADEIEL